MTSNATAADLLAAEMKNLYTLEMHLTKALPWRARGSRDSNFNTAFNGHFKETGVQAMRLEQAAKLLGITTASTAREGWIKEGANDFDQGEDQVGDHDFIGAGARVEHYKKIVGYTTAITLAQSIGAKDVVSLLKNSLADEVAASEELLFMAASLLNHAPSGAKAKAVAV